MNCHPSSIRLRRPIAWLALLSLLAGLLLPTLAHALADERETIWTEICTAQGMKRVPLAADEGASVGTDAPALSLHGVVDHCPLCLLAQGSALAPPPAPFVLPLAAAAGSTPPRFLSAPRTPHVWCTAQARGPPAVQG